MKSPRLPRLSHRSGLLRAPLKVPRTDASVLVNGRRGPRPLVRSLSGFVTAAAICAALFAGASSGNAATLYWDTDGSTTGNSSSTGLGLGGTGTWDTSTSNWWSGSALGAWNNSNNDTAVFWGTAGTVTLGSGITVGGLQFNTSGYTVTGNATNTLTLAGTTPGVTLGSGVSLASVNAVLAGSAGMAFNGGSDAGTLFLNGANANTYTGSTTIDSGTLRIGSLTALGASGAGNTTTVNSGGALRVSVGGTVALEQLSLAGTGVSGGGGAGGGCREHGDHLVRSRHHCGERGHDQHWAQRILRPEHHAHGGDRQLDQGWAWSLRAWQRKLHRNGDPHGQWGDLQHQHWQVE